MLLTACSTTGLKIEKVMRYAKWHLLTMSIVLMIVTFMPVTSVWFR